MLPANGKKIYIKDESFDPIYSGVNKKFFAKSRLIPNTILVIGVIILLTQVVIPLVYFKTADETISPIGKGSVLGIATGFSDFEYKELAKFEGNATSGKNNEEVPKFFYLTIPKLGIENALVESNAKSLSPDFALGHYPNSALPGNVGNAFIYGHSVLPFFYNPKNYKTIFSTLDKLEIGDRFYIKYNDKMLTYKVESRLIVAPDKVNPLFEWKPRYLGESTVTLMTCVPPGTREKRLLVNAVLIKE